MKTPDPRLEWMRQYVEGVAAAETVAQLEQALREDAAFRKLFLEYLNIDLALSTGAALSPPNARGRGGAPVATRSYRLMAWAAVAAAVSMMSAAALWCSMERRVRRTPAVHLLAGYVATLTAQDDAVWQQSGAFRTGQRLMPGPLRLDRGRAVIRFDAGARMVVTSPAEVCLESPGCVRVISGQVAVQAEEEAAGFRVLTPDGMAVDLGTEFVVAVHPSAGTECQVLEGEVEWYSRDGRQRLATLSRGQARRIRAGELKVIESKPAEIVRRILVPPALRAGGGRLLAYESFDYNEGDAPAESLAGGYGWLAPWRGRYIPSDVVDVDPLMRVRAGESLMFPGIAGGEGGRFVFHEMKQWRMRLLATPVEFGRDGVYYLSWLARRPSHPPPVKTPYGRMAITLRCSTNYWAHSISFAISSANRPLLMADGNNRVADRALPANATLLVVGKAVTSRHGPDQLFMKVYEPGETVDVEDPAVWTVASEHLHLDAALDILILGNTGGAAWELDELRYGASWGAVLPANSRDVTAMSSWSACDQPRPRRGS